MLFTVDRLQIVDERLIVFEFFDLEKEHSLIDFNKLKKKLFRIIIFVITITV